MSRRRLRQPWFVRAVANPIVMWLGGATTLVVMGRRSGRERGVPVNVLDHHGHRYLVSPRGEGDWVVNLRAAGRGELRRRGRREQFRAVEVPTEERPEIIGAYRRRWDRATHRYFEALPDPADHPTFRIEPAQSGT